MRIMKRVIIAFTSLLLLATSVMAQNAVMNVRTRNTVAAGQPFQITFDVNARAQNFKMPSLKGLTLLGGPNTGFSSSSSYINGKVSRSVSNTFTIIVQADEEGTANVGAASCTVDGKTVSSKLQRDAGLAQETKAGAQAARADRAHGK